MEELNNEEVLSEEEQRFIVDDDQKAEWCLGKIREAREEMMKWIEFFHVDLFLWYNNHA